MKEIKLTQGKVALVSDKDFKWLNQWKWSAVNGHGYTFYAFRTEDRTGKQKYILMHRLILGLTDPKMEGDHKDHNGLNNQRNNLRIATSSENQSNRAKRKTGTSKYLGVCFLLRGNKWYSQIQKNGKVVYLGQFNNEKDAAIAYNSAAKKLHGKFARLNKITD